MNQSDKKNLEHMKSFGVNYFLTDSPKNWFETKVSTVKSENNKNHDKEEKIKTIINSIKKLRISTTKFSKKSCCI